jgi:hypothetical protein
LFKLYFSKQLISLQGGKLAKKEIANGAETEDLDSTSWQRTYEKLQRAQLRRKFCSSFSSVSNLSLARRQIY